MIPEFAILGHPNEGKSSVLSTLAEDDSVRVSSTPGETIECRTFPVVIDGKELLRFTDTPGFQNPRRVLSELKKRFVESREPLKSFLDFGATVPELHDDCELLSPLQRGAGIIYVVDGSRPVRGVDRAEMEILRLTGKPRMAVINCKEDDTNYLDDWKVEFRKNFNSNRVFNAHLATYAERVQLLEALKSIDQDWQPVLTKVVNAFKKDWANRNNTAADIIVELVKDAITLSLTKNINHESEADSVKELLFEKYCRKVSKKESKSHQQIKALFKHNIFNYELPPHSLLREDLFDEKTWQVLGLTKKQMIIAGGIGGAAIGAGLDVAALGHGLGLFTALGGATGALTALFGGENFSSKVKLLGLPFGTLGVLGSKQVQVGPAKSIDLLFVLLNRALLFYQHTINWAHGKRDYPKQEKALSSTELNAGFTKAWSAGNIKICHNFFKTVLNQKNQDQHKAVSEFHQLLRATLDDISESER